MKRALIVVGVLTLAGCTDHELGLWIKWWQQDPTAAIEYAENLPPEPALRNEQGDGVWEYIADCESGGQWDYPPVTNSSGTYSGGLMIGHRWWPLLGGDEFAPAPYQATRAEQIHVAEQIVDEQGLDAGWQCWP